MLDPLEILKKHWGFSQFRGSQETIISAILEGRDVLALLPTGGGKSVCYQIPALAKPGICIVVAPLVALIQDQVAQLKQKGIKAIALTGGIPFEDVNDLLDNCLYGNYKFLYLSPERLQQDLIRERVQQMDVTLIAIDEAHCISQWGNDFRPSYLECSVLRELLPHVPIIALTATATEQVARDILDNLGLKQPLTVKDSFSRENISFQVLWDEDKRSRLRSLCGKLMDSGIVYVRSRRLAEELAGYLRQQGVSAASYHGGMSKRDKEATVVLWMQQKAKVMVATNAFGMGIDKANVPLVVHYQIPESLESYFQEAGRAGRDQKPAEAILITNKTDEQQVKRQFLSVLPDIAFLKLLYNKLNNYFRIPYGEGAEGTFALDFNSFCDTYKLNTMLAYNGLRILDQNSVLALSDSFARRTSLQFIAQKQELFRYMNTNKDSAPIVQQLLRTYGGVFDHETKINTLLLSKKTNTSEEGILNILERLKKDGIIELQSGNTDLEITFLVPREDDRTIHIFAKKVEGHRQVKISNVESMLAYIANGSVCRSKQLLAYFGEQKASCGICDVCRNKNRSDHGILPLVANEVLGLLRKKPQSSRALIEQLPYKEEMILTVVQQLLEDENIQLNSKNQYTAN